MKIIYGITKSNFGGAQRYVLELATEAKKAGHDVSVICGGNGPLIQKLEQNRIKVILLPHMQRDISIVDELRSFHFVFKTLWEERPDVFHSNSSKMGGIGSAAALIAGVKRIIFTAHGWEFNAPRPWWQKTTIRLFAWITVFLTDRTICVSKKTRKDIARLPFIDRRLVVIHNGINEFELLERDAARKALGIHDNDLLVGTIAELHPTKGVDVLLSAWERFVSKNSGNLVIIGDGEIRENLEDYARELGISERIIFKGFVEEARKYLSAFEIFVLPSRSEALPYVLLEAGLTSRPVVASAVGGVPEIIENGINGTLVPPENSETIFSTLLLLSQDEALRNRLGSALKETVRENFSKEKMVKETLALYR